MPASVAFLRFPHERVFLPRTKLAYVHLRNLLTDAKRDRSARVFGYVAIWLPEELVLLFMQEGELVTATRTEAGGTRALPIQDAIARVPSEPEFGEICFHEADDEQLACMYHCQLTTPEPWPVELDPTNPQALFPYLMATTYDGVVQIVVDGAVNYLIFRDGSVERAFLGAGAKGPLADRVQWLFSTEPRVGPLIVQRWSVPPPLPVQAPHALIQAYRELTTGLVKRLVDGGRESAPEIAEHARRTLLDRHRALESFAVSDRELPDPVADGETLTAAVAAWMTELLWAAADHDAIKPETLLRELTYERRHMFQSAGLFQRLPFEIEW